ncbi:MAG: FecR family protein [Cyanobacteria bacterium J06632_22]
MAPVAISPTAIAQTQQRLGGWLMVQRFQGRVTYQSRSARIGDRLDQAGATITTAARSAARLTLDNNIGSVQVAQNSNLFVRTLATGADGSRVTILDVPQGQVRLQVRRFSNPNSRLEVHTPSGVAAVRGTEFGVSVAEDGRTTIATLSGAVEARGQGQAVLVNPGYVSIIRPGEAPSTPIPLDQDLAFHTADYERQGGQQVRIAGRVNPANTVLIDGQPAMVAPDGRVTASVQVPQHLRLVNIDVTNAMGEQRRQRLWLPYGR